MRSDFETVAVERRDNGILLVTLNRPDAANALNTQMGRDLMELFEGLSIDIEGLRVVILTGQGTKAFCAGGDLKQRNGMTDDAWQAQHLVFERMQRAILACPIPVIAAVNGAAYGGGCEIAAAADFVYASTNARFALTEVTLGIMPGAGGTQTLARAVGERRAKELILSGLPFSATDAEAWGLVNRVLPPEQLLEATFESPIGSPATGPFRCDRPSRRSNAACKCRLRTAWPLRSKPIIAWCRRKTGAKACAPSTNGASRTSAAGDFYAARRNQFRLC